MKTLVWLRSDLRIQDNPALFEACVSGTVIPVFIDEPTSTHSSSSAIPIRPMGQASKVFTFYALQSLYKKLGKKLYVFQGNPLDILQTIIRTQNVTHVYWNRRYDYASKTQDTHIKKTLTDQGINVKSFNGSLLWEPWTVLKKDQTPYKVFTPYFRKGCLENDLSPRALYKTPDLTAIETIDFSSIPTSRTLSDLQYLPCDKTWHHSIEKFWNLSENIDMEEMALDRLYAFLENGVEGYKEYRHYPAKPNTSGLSPFLRCGCISAHQIWYSVQFRKDGGMHNIPQKDSDTFLTELGWREFSYYLSYHWEDFLTENWKKEFDTFEWRNNTDDVQKWQQGQTGIPIIDAGMRQLWQTGTIHNRVRMIVASFLVKNLLIRWQTGEQWFWDCLVDADICSNPAGWQWVAGCGADAAPYFRIFNPVIQGQRFDEDGEYIKTYVPELANLPVKYIFDPWTAPESILTTHNVILGKTYPYPMADLKYTRQRALDTQKRIKS